MINFFSNVSNMLSINSVSLHQFLRFLLLGDSEWLHRYHCGTAARWHSQKFTFPRKVWQIKASEISLENSLDHCKWNGV